jgi:hypothetical protein
VKTMARTFAPASLAIALFGTIVALAALTPTPAEADPVSSGGSNASGLSGTDLGSGRKTTGGKTRGFTDSTTPNSGQTSGAANSDAPTGSETPGAANSDAPTGGKTPGGE